MKGVAPHNDKFIHKGTTVCENQQFQQKTSLISSK